MRKTGPRETGEIQRSIAATMVIFMADPHRPKTADAVRVVGHVRARVTTNNGR